MLYRAVAENLEITLALCRQDAVAEDPVPAYVERELRQYLGCGILARGFGRLHCDPCSRHYFIAFACKSRTGCPACTTRSPVARCVAGLVEDARSVEAVVAISEGIPVFATGTPGESSLCAP